MRTTLTIDADNAVRIKRLRKERDASLKTVVNELIRRALDDIETPGERRKPFKTKAVDLGKPLFNGPQELKELIARLDEEEDLRRLGFK
ncbi:MAG TPA: hypothetical protein VHU87_09275 [Rhizomicrobium sp.]|nr:hypothetical protein [Rhizomicrobium sp.]